MSTQGQTIAFQIEANTNEIRKFNAKFDILKLNLETSNKLLSSFADSFEQIFERNPDQYSYEDIELYITACRFLGKPGIKDKVEEYMNNRPA